MENEKNVSKRTKKVIFWVSLAIFVLGLIFIAFLLINTYLFPEVHDPIPVSSETSSTPEPELPDNPIDFAAEKQKYPDIYAWINIPNTNINYPVVQHPTKDDYYLDHNAEQKYTKAGAIYSELKNSKDFSDPNTVLYGHNMLNGSMFAVLKKYRNAQYFNENSEIKIYTKGHIYTYKIFSAFVYDDRHILNSFDFNKEEDYQDFLDDCMNPPTLIRNVRDDIKVTTDDRIITLSTCTSNKVERYLVVAVLVDDTLTK